MSNTAHTPAPWRIGSVNTIGAFGSNYLIHSCATITPNSISIAEVYKPNDKFKNRETNIDVASANAHLISAAPELLEALEIARERLLLNNCEGEEDYYLAIIESARSKAKGESC